MVHCDPRKLSAAYFSDLSIKVWPENDASKDNIANITALLNCFKLTARPAIQITDRIIATICNLPRGSKIDLLMLTTLLCIREKDEAVYDDIVGDGDFKRAIKGYGGDLNLMQFMTIAYENQEIIRLRFNPLEQVPVFPNDRPNAYTEAEYVIDLKEYFNLFSSFFESTHMTDLRIPSGQQQSDLLSETAASLIDFQSSIHHEENHRPIANCWMRYMYYFDGLDKLKIKDYKDLVELSSSLDWLD